MKTILAIMLFLPSFAGAASLADLQVRELDKTHASLMRNYNESELMNITYVGSSTEAVITITSAMITGYAPAGVVDTDFGVSGYYDISAAAYDTLGELCDAINGDTGYECSLVDGKRSDNPKYLLDQTAASGTNDLMAVGGFNITMDSGTVSATVPLGVQIGITPQSGKRVVLKNCVSNINVISALYVYGKLRKYETATDGVSRNDSTQVYMSAPTVDDTSTVFPYNNAAFNPDGWLEFAKDAHVVIAEAGTSIQASGNFMTCFWEEK